MGTRTFYNRQIFGNIVYITLLLLTIFAATASVYMAYTYIRCGCIWCREDVFLLLFFVPLFAVGIVYLKRIGRQRRRIYEKFKQLSDTEQAEVNAELKPNSQATGKVLLGKNRIYLDGGLFLQFIDYRDIAWVYHSNTAMPFDGGTMAEAAFTGLVVWDRGGIRYSASDNNAYEIIVKLKEKAPDAIFGYSKERLKLAKKDFDRFMFEGKNIE